MSAAGRHNSSGCDGSFRQVRGSTAKLGSAPDALVCPECGALVDVDRLGPDPDPDPDEGEDDGGPADREPSAPAPGSGGGGA